AAVRPQCAHYPADGGAPGRTDPRDDLVSRIALAAQEDGWSEDAARGSIAGLVFGGHETTKNQLGWTVAVLSGHPAVWEGVGSGSLSAADVIEEGLRMRSAVAAVGRTVAEPVEHGGERLEPGTPLFLSLWGADHDEAVYATPESLDAVRHRDTPHMAFGYGAHHCLGAALARAELQEALAVLTARLSCPTVGADTAWKPNAGITGPLRLPVVFEARRMTG